MMKERIKGMQHIGLPTNDMKATIAFYESLGFEDVGTVNTWLILPPGVVL